MRTAKRTPLIHAGRAFVLALAAGLVLVGCMEWSRPEPGAGPHGLCRQRHRGGDV